MNTFTSVLIALVVLAGAWYIAQAVFLGDNNSEGQMTDTLDTAQISSQVEAGDAVLLDVRTTEELAETGYARGAIHHDVALLRDSELPDISTDKKLYVYCRSGVRAEDAVEILEENGYTAENIGGLTDWESAGGEVVTQ